MEENIKKEKNPNTVEVFFHLRSITIYFWFIIFYIINEFNQKDQIATEINELETPTGGRAYIYFLIMLMATFTACHYQIMKADSKIIIYSVSVIFCLDFILDRKLHPKIISHFKGIYQNIMRGYQSICFYFLYNLIHQQNLYYGFDLKQVLWLFIPVFTQVYSAYHLEYENYKGYESSSKQLNLRIIKESIISTFRQYLNLIIILVILESQGGIIHIFVFLLFLSQKPRCFRQEYNFLNGISFISGLIDVDLRRLENANHKHIVTRACKQQEKLLNLLLVLLFAFKIYLGISFYKVYEQIPQINNNNYLVQIIFTLMILDLQYAIKYIYQYLITPHFKGPSYVVCETEQELEDLILQNNSRKQSQLKVVQIEFETKLSFKAVFTAFQNVVIISQNSSLDNLYYHKIFKNNQWYLSLFEMNVYYMDEYKNNLRMLSPEIQTILIKKENNFPETDQIQLLKLSAMKQYPLYIYFGAYFNKFDGEIIFIKEEDLRYMNHNNIVKEYECQNYSMIYNNLVFHSILSKYLLTNPNHVFLDFYY